MNLRNLFTAVIALLALSVGTQTLAARTTTYYHNDGLGSVVAATNEAGQVLWRKDYAPFGEQIDTTPDTEKQSYTGKPHDEVTGLTYFGGRYYDPQTARFMSVDPVAFVDDNTMSFNRYLYVNNNPYKYVDPDGEFLNFVAKFVLDVGVNVAFNYVTTGQMNVGGALKESALGVLNPAKTLAKAGSLAKHMAKSRKVENVSEMGFAAKATARVKPRKGTRLEIEANQPRNAKGKMVDPNNGTQLKKSQIDVGHKPGQEWRKRKADHEAAGSTRKEVLDAENDASLYHLENRASNRSHKFETK
jgi:RHS repeat-associated protein